MNLILGAESMIGREICSILPNTRQITHKNYDLVDFDSCRNAFDNFYYSNDKVVYHLAGFNGSVQFNLKNSAEIYYQTAQINLNVLRCCQIYKVDKVISVIASCAYPDLGDKVLEESDLNRGEPNFSVEPHGYAKRLLLHYSRQLNRQYGIRTVTTVLNNCYGPGDRFALDRTKVVGAVVKKFCDAKLNGTKSLTFFGTGSPKRELMFSRDAAKALVTLAANYDDFQEPINVSSDQEVSIRELVETVAKLTEYEGEVLWDTTKTDGQMRKKLSTAKMRKFVNFQMTPFEDGLHETIAYYMEKGRFLER